MLSKTPVENISFVLQIMLLWLGYKMPKAQPEKIQTRLIFAASAVSLYCTWIGFSLGPGALPFSPIYFAVGLLLVALAAPIIGILEQRHAPPGKPIFDQSRFWPHFISNFLGAIVVSAFILLARSTPGFDDFVHNFEGNAAFNIVLPMTVLVIFAFVRVQQLDHCSRLDRLVRQEGNWQECIRGYSLRHIHQFLNTLYLIFATFAAATMILYLFGYSVRRAKVSSPLPFTWQLGAAMIVLILFLLSCALAQLKVLLLRVTKTSPYLAKLSAKVKEMVEADKDRESSGMRAVYLTFLTGTPATLVVMLIWFALLQESVRRNIAATLIIGGGYLLYTAVVVSEVSGDDGGKVRLHYFSAAAFATVLVVLAGALYYS